MPSIKLTTHPIKLNIKTKSQADRWDRDEVINHWHRLFSGNLLSQRIVRGEALNKVELKLLEVVFSPGGNA